MQTVVCTSLWYEPRTALQAESSGSMHAMGSATPAKLPEQKRPKAQGDDEGEAYCGSESNSTARERAEAEASQTRPKAVGNGSEQGMAAALTQAQHEHNGDSGWTTVGPSGKRPKAAAPAGPQSTSHPLSSPKRAVPMTGTSSAAPERTGSRKGAKQKKKPKHKCAASQSAAAQQASQDQRLHERLASTLSAADWPSGLAPSVSGALQNPVSDLFL